MVSVWYWSRRHKMRRGKRYQVNRHGNSPVSGCGNAVAWAHLHGRDSDKPRPFDVLHRMTINHGFAP